MLNNTYVACLFIIVNTADIYTENVKTCFIIIILLDKLNEFPLKFRATVIWNGDEG